MKNFFKWLEQENSRSRRVVLFLTIFVFLLITISVFGAGVFGITIQTPIVTIYGTLAAFMVSVYGFFTGTSSDKSSKLADKAADILMDKLNKK
jgi:uncharacterized membrane protein YiaA